MEADKDIINRLKRVEGQIRGIIRMIEEEKDCRSVIHQMNAAKTAIDRAIGYTVVNHLENSIWQYIEAEHKDNQALEEAIDLVIKSR